MLGSACAHMTGSKVAAADAAEYETIEEFVQGNFVMGVQSFADSLPTGKPKHTLDDGTVRYAVPACGGQQNYVEKPEADLRTFCEVKGGKFSPGGSVVNEGAATFNCSGGKAGPWSATVRVEGVGPGSSPDCNEVTLLIRGETLDEAAASPAPAQPSPEEQRAADEQQAKEQAAEEQRKAEQERKLEEFRAGLEPGDVGRVKNRKVEYDRAYEKALVVDVKPGLVQVQLYDPQELIWIPVAQLFSLGYGCVAGHDEC